MFFYLRTQQIAASLLVEDTNPRLIDTNICISLHLVIDTGVCRAAFPDCCFSFRWWFLVSSVNLMPAVTVDLHKWWLQAKDCQVSPLMVTAFISLLQTSLQRSISLQDGCQARDLHTEVLCNVSLIHSPDTTGNVYSEDCAKWWYLPMQEHQHCTLVLLLADRCGTQCCCLVYFVSFLHLNP